MKLIKTIGVNLSNIVFPFLLVRNRWTGLHYNDWKLQEEISRLYSESTNFNLDKCELEIIDKKKYRKYKLYNFYNQYILQIFHWWSTTNEWTHFKYNCPGWYKVFGKKLLFQLWWNLLISGRLYSFRIIDIKEKYGHIDFSVCGATPKIYKILNEYSKLSKDYCVDCGKPAVYFTNGYLCPYCKDCCPQNIDKVLQKKIHGKWIDVNEFG